MKKDTKNLIELLKYYKKYKFLSIGVIILSLAYAGISLLSPIYEGKMLGFFEDFDKTNIIKIALFLLILRIIIEIVTNLWSRVVLKLNGKVNFDLKRDMLESLTNFEVKNFDNTNSGIFISRLNKDTTELSELFDYITDDLSGIILNVSFIVYVLYLNAYLGIFLILNIILVYMLTSKKLFYYKRVKKDYKEKDEKTVGLYTDIIRGIREIKNLNLKEIVLKETNAKQLETIKAEIKTTHTRRTWNRWIAVFQHILDFIFVLLSIHFIMNNTLQVSSFLIIFLYKNKVLNLINYISEIREKLADGKVSSSRVFDIITYKSFVKENFGTLKVNNIKGNIEFKNVDFSYSNEKLLENLNFAIRPNRITAITGTNGTGKTTIVDLILRLHSPTKGEILLDNINVKEIDKNSYLKEISVLNQESYLFNLSIRENFNLVENDIKKQEEMCKLTGIDKFIKTLPKGYDTIIDENSHNISGGQKRLLSLTRTLLKDAKILIFDEATSSLDTDKIQNVINVLNELKKNHTVIVITHKKEIENIADEVITINDGKVKIKTPRVSDITVKNY